MPSDRVPTRSDHSVSTSWVFGLCYRLIIIGLRCIEYKGGPQPDVLHSLRIAKAGSVQRARSLHMHSAPVVCAAGTALSGTSVFSQIATRRRVLHESPPCSFTGHLEPVSESVFDSMQCFN